MKIALREKQALLPRLCLLHPTSHCLLRIPWYQARAAEQKAKSPFSKHLLILTVLGGCDMLCVMDTRVHRHTTHELMADSQCCQSKTKREGWLSWRGQQSHKSAKAQPPAPGEPSSSDPLHGMGRGKEDSDLQLMCWEL